MPKKLTYEYVKKYFEDNGCELLESEYVNSQTKMKYKCSCGNESNVKWSNFQQGQRQCNICCKNNRLDYNFVYEYFAKCGCTLLEKEYISNETKMKYRCKCGNISKTTFNIFRKSQQCKTCGINSKTIDLTGKKFGKLTVIKRIENYIHKNGTASSQWECICDCGNIKNVRSHHLKGNKVKSCGCYLAESTKKRFQKSIGQASYNEILYRYKKSAENRNIGFSLTEIEFQKLINNNCFYCGKPPSQSVPKSYKYNGDYIHNGIDRVDSNLGYNIGNVVSCCEWCNKMKNKYSQQEFLDHIEKIHNYQKERK